MSEAIQQGWTAPLWPAQATLAPGALALPPRSAGSGISLRRLQFGSVILLLVLLFLRPGDVFPSLEDVPCYLLALAAAAALGFPLIVEQLRLSSLRRQPITLCVLALCVVAVASNAVHGDLYDARLVAKDFLSILLLYLLVVGTADTPARLRKLLLWTTGLILVQAAQGLLQYHGLVDVGAGPYLETQDELDPVTKLPVVLARLCGTGIFDNPNELSRILVVGGLLALYFLNDRTRGRRRLLWAAPLLLLAATLQLTYSRGGFLALMAGMAVLIIGKFGRVRSVLVGALLLPLMLLVFSGRITDIDTSQGTGQDRIQLWRDAFDEMKSSPVLGIGVYHLADQIGLVAHNSFVQCYVEMGVVGGVLFAGAFYLAFWMPYRLGPQANWIVDAELRRLCPYLLAIIAGVIVGMFSSTRCYRLETYLLLGIVAAYLRLVQPQLPGPAVKVNPQLLLRITVVGLAGLLAFFFYARWAAR